MKKIILSLICFLFLHTISGQSTRNELSQLGIFSSQDFSQAKVYINQEPALNEIIIAKTQTQKDYEVWSIQIYMGSGKNARAVANSTISSFKSRFSDVEARLLYLSPYFKVQVGNFKTRLEAESFRQKILGDFPNSRIELAISSKENN